MWRYAVAVLVALSVAPAASKPSTMVGVLQEFDLFGTWASDCDADASVTNPRVSVTMKEPDQVVERHDFGPGYEPNRYRILSARRLDKDRLAIETLFEQEGSGPQLQRIVMRFDNGGRRTILTVPKGEEPRVVNGIAVASGLPTPRLRKCD
jgi:hypothetical protein